jgi:hypothetical protein
MTYSKHGCRAVRYVGSHACAHGEDTLARVRRSIRISTRLERTWFACKSRLLGPIRRWIDLHDISGSRMIRDEPIHIAVELEDADVADATTIDSTICESLRLLSAYAPRHMNGLTRAVRCVLLQRAPNSSFLTASRVIVLDLSMVRRGDPLLLAAILVHEATHARIAAAGIHAYRDLQARIERRCLLEQVGFLCKVPGGEPLAEYFSQFFEVRWWDNANVTKRRVGYFSDIGVPIWLVRLYASVSRVLHRGS